MITINGAERYLAFLEKNDKHLKLLEEHWQNREKCTQCWIGRHTGSCCPVKTQLEFWAQSDVQLYMELQEKQEMKMNGLQKTIQAIEIKNKEKQLKSKLDLKKQLLKLKFAARNEKMKM